MVPGLVTFTWTTVTFPTGRDVDGESGRHDTLSGAGVRSRVTLNGCVRAVPATWL